ncbi:pyridoxamine 5'-phosphate oxidase family protein [Actinopolymorpha singaporensis]
MVEYGEPAMIGCVESLRLLGSTSVGRVVFTIDALPAVEPVAFVLDDEHVVFRTVEDSQLDTATRNTIVAFQADEIDAIQRGWWTVVTIGYAHAVTEPAETARLSKLPLPAWTCEEPTHFVLIRMDIIQGQRLDDGGTLHG